MVQLGEVAFFMALLGVFELERKIYRNWGVFLSFTQAIE